VYGFAASLLREHKRYNYVVVIYYYSIFLINIILTILIALIRIAFYDTGQVSLSPSGIASICHGEQLNLVCTSHGGFLEWSFFANDGLSDGRYTRILSTISQMSQLMINQTVFTFSRISGENSLPLTSRLSISPIGGGLNGTLVNCTDLATFNTSSATIDVVNEGQIHDQGTFQALTS
jgi:hypothetical protein